MTHTVPARAVLRFSDALFMPAWHHCDAAGKGHVQTCPLAYTSILSTSIRLGVTLQASPSRAPVNISLRKKRLREARRAFADYVPACTANGKPQGRTAPLKVQKSTASSC